MTYGKDCDILFRLLRAGLWETEANTAGLLPASADDWRSVFGMARQQTVTGIAFRGLDRLPDDCFPPDSIMDRWMAEVDRIERHSNNMNKAVSSLCGFFGTHALHPILLKGQGIAAMYEHPLLREAGDIDLYFPHDDDRRHAEALLHEAGIVTAQKSDGSTVYTWQDIEVEHHPTLTDLHNPSLKKYLNTLEQTEGYMPLTTDGGGDNINVPSPMLTLLLLNTHILKHAIGRGIGLRQLCDMARAYHTLHRRIDGQQLHHIYHRTGIARWSRLLHSFLTGYLGLPEEELPYREAHTPCDALLHIVMRGGNFGQYRDGMPHETQSAWAGKLHTATSFMQNSRFSLRYAPSEMFWTVTGLMRGQLKN